MARCYIDEDEWYPVLSLTNANSTSYYADSVEIPDEKIEWVKSVYDEFEHVQDYLAGLLKEIES